MEHSQFVKDAGPILVEYQRARKKLSDQVAGRGFSFEPGFMYDAQNNLETDVKMMLDQLNYTILQGVVERDIKQAGMDYDLAFRNAQIAWELDKQVLLTDWDKELSIVKQAREHEDALLDLIAIEVSKRASLLLEAKTAIELEAEAIRLQIAELDGTTSEYELQLANAKLLTANKKLEVIPIMQQIIAIEEDMIDKEREMIGKAWILAGQAQTIVQTSRQIIAKEEEIAENQKAIIDAEKGMLAAEEYLVDDIGGTGGKISKEKDYLTDAKTTAQSIIDLISPLLTSLIDEMDAFILEIPTQETARTNIALKKGEIAAVKSNIALQYTQLDGIVDKKKEITKTMDELIVLTEALSKYKTESFGPALSELIQVYKDYAQDVVTGTGFKMAIAQVQKQIKNLEITKTGKEILLTASEVAKQAQISALNAAKLANQTLEAGNKVAIANQKVTDTTARVTALDQSRTRIVEDEAASFETIKTAKETYQTTDLDAKLEDATTLETARQTEDTARNKLYIDMANDVADIEVTTNVTAKLTHLLSQD